MAKRALRRDFRGRRWLTVALRGLHLIAIILLGADLLGAPDLPVGHTSAALAVLATGTLMFALDVWSSPHHLVEVSGASVLVKLVLVAGLVLAPEWRQPLFWTIVAWSVVFSHAPASFRHVLLRPGAPPPA